MEFTPAGRRWTRPPLVLLIVTLLLGSLIVAQLVTLILTLLLPPEPQQQTSLDDIASALLGTATTPRTGKPLQRVVQPSPPELAGPGWLTSERSRHDLAVLLGRSDAEVQLYFFTPLPFAGTARTMPRGARRDDSGDRGTLFARSTSADVRLTPVDYVVAQAGRPGGPSGNGPGPGGNVNGATADGFVGPNGPATRGNGPRGMGFPGDATSGSVNPVNPFNGTRIQSGGPMASDTRARPQDATAPTTTTSGAPSPLRDTTTPTPTLVQPGGWPPVRSGSSIYPSSILAPERSTPERTTTRTSETTTDTPRAPPTVDRPVVDVVRPRTQTTIDPRTTSVTKDPPIVVKVAPIAVAGTTRGLFGLGPAPFVEGDFVAALQVADGWAVVQPVPEPFPNTWQRRVLLWFAIAFALIAPLGWLFSRRLVRPISGFAAAAERLGRDPTAPTLAIEGPAEIGRAAHAFNRMQSRLRSFVDDRTAMIGAISHDLRTPLTRLRFRIEDVDETLRDGMLHEVDEMEAMITSVLAFIRDASEPGSREKLDLSTLVEDVVEDAVFVGKDVRLTLNERAPVEVDAIGMRRLLANLVENAVKYGDHARVRLFTDRQDAVTEVSDDGPGLPDEELERVFQPFYRAPTARLSGKLGSGLGLAVCRSIARAHGGDVHLMRGERGLIAQVRVPLAYGR